MTASVKDTKEVRNTKSTKMPTLQEMQELYEKITPLQKIVTLQHIYSLYMAASQNAEKKDVSFNIIQLQRMINSNPLVNPDFDFLNISKFLSNYKDNTKDKKDDKKTTEKGQNNTSLSKGPVSPVQLIQILTESLTLRDERGQNEQVIQQVPNSMLFKLSQFIDLNFVKDRLIKLLNSYKNDTLKEIEELEHKWRVKKAEILNIEEGKMDDGFLYEEFLKDLKKKRSTTIKADSNKKTVDVKINTSLGDADDANNQTDSSSGSRVASPNLQDTQQNKKLQISRNVSKTVEKTIEGSTLLSGNEKESENENEGANENENEEEYENENADENSDKNENELEEAEVEGKVKAEAKGLKRKLEEPLTPSKRSKKEEEYNSAISDHDLAEEKAEQVKTRSRTRSMANSVSNEEKAHLEKVEKATETDKNVKHESKRFQQLSVPLITQISSHRIASLFLTPVNINDQPEYNKLIKQPTDLKSIVRQIKAGEISTVDQLELKMQLMFTNAIMYNDDIEGMKEGILDMMNEWDKLVVILKENF
ncbi:hypothetical protein CANINC_003257 [Pichia inconspicua]|uniref:Bromo domain-containing protein n=1 Tax=Pichia inconspicua TaxID=52247 RepID=A0A4T0WZ58_9ASCO|nr:hypothetical protein CANINC_003257 [[Candida] inconspicua]